MNREQAIVILKILKTAYPRFYANITKQEAEDMIGLWVDMFKAENPDLVITAVKDLINTFQFPPTIADVKNAMYKLTNNTASPLELWNELDKATRNCLYKEREVFESLSEPVKRFLGSPAQLRELALGDKNTFQTVTKGQFLKQIEIIQQREKEDKMMLPETKAILQQLKGAVAKDINLLEG